MQMFFWLLLVHVRLKNYETVELFQVPSKRTLFKGWPMTLVFDV